MSTEKRVVKIIENLLHELTGSTPTEQLTANTHLEKDLGMGSIERSELIHRVEQQFQVKLPDSALANITTIKQLISAIENAKPISETGEQTTPDTQQVTSQQKHTKNLKHADSLNEVLQTLAHAKSQEVHIRLLSENDATQATLIRYYNLYEQALKVAASLKNRHIQSGDTVAIMLPTDPSFFPIFFGVLYAGAIPVPIYPPLRQDEIERYVNRQIHILQNAQVRALVTFAQVQKLTQLVKPFIKSLHTITTANELIQGEMLQNPAQPATDEIALLQYTSGSTGYPKGVVLTHENLLSNIRAIGQALAIYPEDVAVSWLPLYHDMGLIGMWLGSLYHEMPLVLMSPITFLTRPERWLWAIHNHKGTIAGGPNFGYEFCLNRVDDRTIKGLDLSSWRIAFNGAEAVYASTLEQFAEKFTPYGFKREAHFPVYGLAENSVALTFPQHGPVPNIDYVDRQMVEKESYAQPASSGDKNTLRFVGCGHVIPEHEIRIVSQEGEALSDRYIGEIEFHGPSSMQGYSRNVTATQKTHHNGWWRTGDMGYIVDDELFITGRKKDIIIKAGHNIYPEEVEALASEIQGVRKGCVASFGVNDPNAAGEKFVIVAEIKPNHQQDDETLKRKIAQRVGQISAVAPDEVVLVQPHTVPKTSSGKLQRHACKTYYTQNKLHASKRRRAWQQFGRLVLKSAWQQIKSGAGFVCRCVYGVYVLCVLTVTTLMLWLGLMLTPRKLGAQLTKAWARGLLALCFCPYRVYGLDNLRDKGVIVVNHTSYVDTLFLLAALPSDIAFVAKQGLARIPILNFGLKRLDHLTVPRQHPQESLAQLDQLHQKFQHGKHIVIFPEGTFTQAQGLKPFKLGAFKLAAEANRPVYPTSLRGTRHILPAGYLLPRPNNVTITINPALNAQGNNWQAYIQLRNQAYQTIAEQCGETV